jgi:hypothetical protein
MKVSDQLHALSTLPSSKESPVPKDEAETGHLGEDMNFLSLPECKHCTIQPIA